MSRLSRAIASNYVVLAAQAAYLTILTPLIISKAGAQTFGRWALILAIIAYLRLLDLGVGPTTARFVATAQGDEVGAVVSSSIALLTGVAGMATLAGAIVGVVSLTGGPDSEFELALAITIISRAAQLPLAVAGYTLYGLGRIVERNLFASIRSGASTVAVTVAVLLGGNLVVFVFAGACLEIAVMLAQSAFVISTVGDLRISLRRLELARMWNMIRFTAGLLTLSITNLIIVNSDTIVIGAFLGTATVAVYAIAMRIIEGSTMLLNQISDVFLPEFARAHTGEREMNSREVVRIATRATVCLAFALAGLFVAFGDRLISAWVGPGFAGSWTPLLLLSSGLIFHAPLRFSVLWAIAENQHRRLIKIAAAEAAANIALTVGFVGPFGMRGVAAASLMTFTVWSGWLIPRKVFPQIGLDRMDDFLRPIIVAAVAVLPVAVLMHAAMASLIIAPVAVGLAGFAWFGVLLIALWRIVLGAPDRLAVRRALGHRIASR